MMRWKSVTYKSADRPRFWMLGYFRSQLVYEPHNQDIGAEGADLSTDSYRFSDILTASFLHRSQIVREGGLILETSIDPNAGRFLVGLWAFMFVGLSVLAVANVGQLAVLLLPLLLTLGILLLANVVGWLHHQSNLSALKHAQL